MTELPVAVVIREGSEEVEDDVGHNDPLFHLLKPIARSLSPACLVASSSNAIAMAGSSIRSIRRSAAAIRAWCQCHERG